MPGLTIVANIQANPEEGCIQYDLYQDNENPAHFLFYENWESRELWQAHMEATEGEVAEFTLNEMTRIG